MSTSRAIATRAIEIAVFTAFLGIAAAATDVSWRDRATMTNTFATVSGVFLGLYFVIRSRRTERNTNVTFFLLVSIFTSLISSLLSYDQKNSLFLSQYTLWLLSVVVFAGSSVYFAIDTQSF